MILKGQRFEGLTIEKLIEHQQLISFAETVTFQIVTRTFHHIFDHTDINIIVRDGQTGIQVNEISLNNFDDFFEFIGNRDNDPLLKQTARNVAYKLIDRFLNLNNINKAKWIFETMNFRRLCRNRIQHINNNNKFFETIGRELDIVRNYDQFASVLGDCAVQLKENRYTLLPRQTWNDTCWV